MWVSMYRIHNVYSERFQCKKYVLQRIIFIYILLFSYYYNRKREGWGAAVAWVDKNIVQPAEDIVNDWYKIFPDRNRNAAGPKFFKYIIDKDISYEDFVEYNKLYCAVSGSLISPNATPEFVYLKEVSL